MTDISHAQINNNSQDIVNQNKEMKLPKLSKKKDYILQGTIYYCQDKKKLID